MDIPTLETNRLIMRSFRASDIDDYTAMVSHPDVSPFISVSGEPMDRLEAWKHMATAMGHWALRGFGIWAIEEKTSGQFVGRSGLHYPETWPGGEVGYALVRKHWGKGYATEAVCAARDYAFEKLNWNEVISIIRPNNTRSIAVAKRIGETFKETWTIQGVKTHVYAITRADWEKLGH